MSRLANRLLLLAVLAGFVSIAQAQWIWINEKGVKQLSDQPPPHGTPSDRILKALAHEAPSAQQGASRAAPARPQTPSYDPDKAFYCKEAREYVVLIEAGGRLLYKNGKEKGLPVSEKYRAQLLRETRTELEKNCKDYAGK